MIKKENYEKFQTLLNEANKQKGKLINRIDMMRSQLVWLGITNDATMFDFADVLEIQTRYFNAEANGLQQIAYETKSL